MDIREVLRRWEAGDSRRQIAAATKDLAAGRRGKVLRFAQVSFCKNNDPLLQND